MRLRAMYFSAAMAGIALLAMPRAAWAANLVVNCGTGDSIQAALDSLDVIGPHTISVTGSCHESVNVVDRDRVTIQGDGAQ